MQENRNCSSAFPTTNITNRAIRDVFELLAEGETKLCNQRIVKDAILVLGNTGAGKSAFTRTIAGYDETLRSVDEEGVYYTINNPYNKNEKKSFTTSSTIFPEQVQDNGTNAVYYDFPGFQDTRGMAHDITTTYFIKKIVDSVERVKILLLVNYTSLTNTGTRDDFTNILSYVTKFVKHIDKYKDGIALIATKVQYPTKSDDQIISAIAKFIETVKQNLEQQADSPKAANAIKLLDVLLQQDNNTFPKITIFRSPDQEGYLRDIPIVQENMVKIKLTLAKLKFVEKTDTDFGYTIPKQSLIDVDKIFKEITRSFTTSVREIGKEMKKYLLVEEDQVSGVSKLYNLTSSRYDELRQIKDRANDQEDLEKCTLEIIDGAASMDVHSLHRDMLMKYANYSSFLRKVSDYTTQTQFKCADGMQDVIEHSNRSREWYHFLNKLYERLSDYEIQRNTLNSPCTELAENVARAVENEKNSEFNLDPLVIKKCYPNYDSEFGDIRNVAVGKSKLNALEKVLNLTLMDTLSYSCNSDKLVIKGQNVKLGDILEIQKRECTESPKFIEIFALSKIFINADLDKTGEQVQLSIVAPTWDIQGSRKITLDGAPGKAHDPLKASDGTNAGNRGRDGLPGLPGGPAGNFVGIGEVFKNLQELTISVRGGDGGPGQDGGDGENGQYGVDAYNDVRLKTSTFQEYLYFFTRFVFAVGDLISDHHKIIERETDVIFNKVLLSGKSGEKGGDGGNGGMGGLGGNPGEIIFTSMASSGTDHINKVTEIGSKGSGGKGGKGASGGKHGNHLRVDVPVVLKIFRDIVTTRVENYARAASGERGIDAYNDLHRKHPIQSEKISNPGVIVNEYKNYARENINQSVGESYSTEFLRKLDNIEHFLNQRRRRRYVDYADETLNVGHEKALEANNITPNNSNNVGVIENIRILKIHNTNTTKYIIPDDSTFAKSAGVRINSPINSAVNLVRNFLGQWKIFSAANIMNYGLVKVCIEFMFREPTFLDLYTTARDDTNHKTTLGNININESLTLADFAIRYMTKEKFYNSEAKPTDFSEVKASVINIITEFEEILSEMSVQYNLPLESFTFNPVTLISELEKELINRNYKNVAQILCKSIESSTHLRNPEFRTHMLRTLEEVMEKQKIDYFEYYHIKRSNFKSHNEP